MVTALIFSTRLARGTTSNRLIAHWIGLGVGGWFDRGCNFRLALWFDVYSLFDSENIREAEAGELRSEECPDSAN